MQRDTIKKQMLANLRNQSAPAAPDSKAPATAKQPRTVTLYM